VTELAPAVTPAETTQMLITVAIVFVAAKLSGEIAARLGIAPLVGELAAGVTLGPHALGLIPENEVTVALADLGVIVLLFAVGLETEFHRLQQVGARGVLVGAVGIVLPFIGGAALMWLTGHETPVALFVGTALVATSVGITARVLGDLGLMGKTESLIILAAAVADDVFGLIVLAVVTSLGTGIDVVRLGLLLVETIVFVAILLTVGRFGMQRHGHRVAQLRIAHGPLAFALVLCLGLAILANVIGLAAIVGAYLAGLLIAELSDEFELKRDVGALQALLVPFFFVMVGARMDLRGLADPATIGIGLALTLIAIATKLVGCGLAMYGTSFRSALMVGIGMVPRGEVGLVVATIGLAAGVIDATLYAAVLMMVAATTLVAPFLIGPVFGPPEAAEPRRIAVADLSEGR
jgi:Kef-type K+ transport system membrane component KefB